ncbi:MAG: hypothetical protein HJJLKODD_02992 [Phycisphaerae bacterium]|nr:hypothetical protein [Phycisphaerae bacterium]
MEPITDYDHVQHQAAERKGFQLRFDAKVKYVTNNPAMIEPLLRRARKLYDLDRPPPGRSDCDDCRLVYEMMECLG